jgi:hypothetical protein
LFHRLYCRQALLALLKTLFAINPLRHHFAPIRPKLNVDEDYAMWDNPTMSISIVDSKKRIVLQSGQPGDVFEIQQQTEGRFVLIRLEKPERAVRRMTKKASMEAMRKAPLRSTMTWDKLRRLTREP